MKSTNLVNNTSFNQNANHIIRLLMPYSISLRDEWLQHANYNHVTLYAGQFEFDEAVQEPHQARIEPPAQCCSLHVYGIEGNNPSVELRNAPMSTRVESLLKMLGATIDRGQTYISVQFGLNDVGVGDIRSLAESIRRVPRDGRIDPNACAGSQARPVWKALLTLAAALERYNHATRPHRNEILTKSE